MQPKGGVFACMGCGAEADLRNEDGSRAMFTRAPAPGSGQRAVLISVLLLLLAAGAAGWAFLRFGAPGLKGPARPLVAEAAATPEMRTGLAAAFEPGVREGLIASFGTSGADDVLGLTVLSGGRIAVLLRSRSASAPDEDAVHLVFLDGGETLAAARLAVRGLVRSGSVAALPDGSLLALIADAGGLRLEGLDPAGVRLWKHEWPTAGLGPAAPALMAEQGVIAVTAPVEAPRETPGDAGGAALMAAMLTPDGRLAWQRTFAAASAGGAAAALDGGDLLLTYPSTGDSGEAGHRLVRLSSAGDTLSDAPLEGRFEAVAALVAGPGTGARLLAGRPLPAVSSVTSGGTRLWETEVLAALLNDRLFLMPEAGGGVRVLSAYRLSDVQTDVSWAEVDASGALATVHAARLPPGAEIGAVFPVGGGRVLVAGSAPAKAGEASDAFVLSLGGAGSAPGAGVPLFTAPPPPPRPAPPGASGADVLQYSRPDTGPTPDPKPGPEPGIEQGPEAAPGGRGGAPCTFACLGQDGPFRVQQTVSLAEAGGAAGLRDIQSIVCRAGGGTPYPAERPACAAP